MKTLAIDFGTKRVGLAVGEDGQPLFSKMMEVASENQAVDEVVKIVEREGVGTIVIGLPLRLNGSEKEEAKRARQFAARLVEGKHIPIVFIDERLTSVEAKQMLADEGIAEREMRHLLDQKVAELLLAQHFRERGT